ncbi:tetratricopeptide repeat protein [Roseibacillus ishigakijimensis]|uniref:Tetratricopeptide repeat protein n=1 Tax=Roseibacillus ishigakijimensis TaxID=454146 RepID=A0A934RJM3_9BACT|nr:tetratricopeptide repeat protein [Roseibacillus ishigakijimensis]MBK1832634.1 tetratricopeptide repeat protein [Roseibacillus ishigakijimensis]
MGAPTMIEQQLPFVEVGGSPDWRETENRIREAESNKDLQFARKIANSAVEDARSAQNGTTSDAEQLLFCLEARADLFNRLGEQDAAKDDYFEAISLVAGKAGQEQTVGRLYGSLGYLFESIGKSDEAIDAYERGLEQLGRLRKPVILDEIRLSNNLAFLYSQRDEFDQAETLFLKALKLAHEELGKTNPDTTGVANNVGALYQKAGHYEQAMEMHQIALEGRKSDGSSRADIAQSYGNLAVVFAEQGNQGEALSHFESALSAYKKAGPEWSDDFEAVCENYLQFLKQTGDEDRQRRVQTLLEEGLSE